MKHILFSNDGKIEEVRVSPWRALECDDTVSDVTHYVAGTSESPTIEPRTAFTVTIEHDGLSSTLTGIPTGSTVTVNNASLTTDDDQPLTIEFDIPGTYQIEIEPPIQYRAETLEVTVDGDT